MNRTVSATAIICACSSLAGAHIIVTGEPFCEEIPGGRFLYSLPRIEIDESQFFPSIDDLLGPDCLTCPFFELVDVPDLDDLTVSFDPDAGFNVPFGAFTRLESPFSNNLNVPDDPNIPNLLLAFGSDGSGPTEEFFGPALLGSLRFETTSNTPLGLQRFIAQAYDKATGEPLPNSGEFTFVPAPSTAALLAIAGVACGGRRRR